MRQHDGHHDPDAEAILGVALPAGENRGQRRHIRHTLTTSLTPKRARSPPPGVARMSLPTGLSRHCSSSCAALLWMALKGKALNVCPSGTKRLMLLWNSALPYLAKPALFNAEKRC